MPSARELASPWADWSDGLRSRWSAFRTLAHDRQFRAVVFLWALCCLGQVLYINAFGVSLPWCDEWWLTARASGHEPLTWEWLWRPANEHRAPLTRLALLVLGRLTSWDWQVIHYVGLTSVALGSLSLLVAARAVRGRTTLSDAFLCLLPLSPWHFQTLMMYGYAYAMASGLVCLAISLASVRWPLRSIPKLVLYLLMVLGVALSAGPAGNFWAMGLCGVVMLAMFEGTSTRWKLIGLSGTTIVTAISVAMLLVIPHVPKTDPYHSQSVLETLTAGAKISVGWMGEPPLKVLWPWALVVILVPVALLLKRFLLDLGALFRSERAEAQALRAWWGLGVVLLSAFLVTAAMGYGRGRYPGPWDSRYLALTQPIGIVIYLLMIRLRVAPAIPQTLAVGMAVCVGWCWPKAIETAEGTRPAQVKLVKMLRRGTVPLSVVASQYRHLVGLLPQTEEFSLECFLQLREANLSVFRDRRRRFHHRRIPRPQVLRSVRATLSGGLKPVADETAVSRRAIEMTAGSEGAGVATYEINVRTGGSYQVCCRLRTETPGQSFAVMVDQGPRRACPLSEGPAYRPYVLEPPFEISAGKHNLAVVLPQPGTRLDLIELVPHPVVATPSDHP